MIIHINWQNKIKKYKDILFIIITTLLLLLIIIGVRYNYKYYSINDRTKQVSEFRYINKEKAIGWIRIQGTNIDLPILDYYQVDDISDPTYDIAWTRLAEEKKRIVVVSHNMRNVSSHPIITDKNHARFEQLMSFVYTDFAKKNQYIQFTIDGKNHLYRIYSVNFIPDEIITDYIGNQSTEEKDEYIKYSLKTSLYDYSNISVSKDDNTITLVTCTRFFGVGDDRQFVVNARKVKESEKIKRYEIKENKNYKEIKKILNSKE